MLLYAYGGRAPSARDIPDRWVYELALDTGWTPDQIRAMNTRDRNKVILVRDARILGAKQRAQTE